MSQIVEPALLRASAAMDTPIRPNTQLKLILRAHFKLVMCTGAAVDPVAHSCAEPLLQRAGL